MGIAKDSLELAAGTEPWKGEHGGQRLGVLHGSSWSNTTRSVPQISDKIRGLAALAQTQTGYGVGRLHALSFTHSNVR